MSMLMVAAVFVPVSAEDSSWAASVTNKGVTVEGSTTIGTDTVYFVSDTNNSNWDSGKAILVTDASNVTGDENTVAALNNVKAGTDGDYKKLVTDVNASELQSVVVVDVHPNQAAANLVNAKTELQIKINYSGIESGATYYAVHWGKGTKEAVKCEAGDGTLSFTIHGCSPVIIYKVVKKAEENTNNNSGSNNQSSGKAITCESEHGKGWVWSESKNACVYKVTNTSAK